MKVDKYKVLGELIETNKRQFIIPVYQRNYDWTTENCKTLAEDIISAFVNDRPHFIGSIVYVDQGEENKIYRYLIIDGQQRITTIFILLKALYDISQSESLRGEIFDIIFNIDKYNDLKLTEQTKIKLKPIKSDNDQFLLLMNNELDNMDKSSNIYLNYNFMKLFIQKANSKGMDCKDILSGLKKLTSAVIILDPKEDNPQVVFESINSTGKGLSLADLIRNYILMTDTDQERLFEQYWLKIEENVTPNNMPNFITDYLQFACKETVTTKNAYSVFKNNFIGKHYTNETMLNELLNYSNYYKAFLFGDYKNYSKIVNKRLLDLRTIDQATIYPFLFCIFDDFSKNILTMDELEKVLTFFFNYLLRRIVCDISSNSLRGLYKTLYNRIFANTAAFDNYYDSIIQFFSQLSNKNAIPSDSAFKVALLNSDIYNKRAVCKYMLNSIENINNDGTESKEAIDIKTLTIEHIMPQVLTTDWKNYLGQDYARIYEKYLHNLGNLSLTGYNPEMGQKPFDEKKKAIISNSHIVVLNQDIINQDVWNEAAIINRAERLSNILMRIFKIDKTTINTPLHNKNDKQFTLDESYDVSGSKIKFCIFIGINMGVSSFSEMLIKIMHALYELDSNILLNLAIKNYKIANANRVYITTDSSLLRRPTKINNTNIYFETNLSSNNILSFIRNMLDEYQLDYDELVICCED